jgi:uncharacterized protein
MGERTSYESGTFNWVELGTDDPEASCGFYSEVFGWEGEELPGGHGSYTLFRVGGRKVAAIIRRGEKQPVNAWNAYIAVDDVDAAADQASALGGTVAAGPFDLPGAGRAAFILDPTGAAVGLWEAREHIGAELVNDPNAFSLTQLNTSDPQAAMAFFEGLFGWRTQEIPGLPQPLWMFFRDEREESMQGSLMKLPEGAEWPSHWIVYFTVESLDGTLAKFKELGGSVQMPPIEIETGRVAIALDPQGAVVALYEGEVHP